MFSFYTGWYCWQFVWNFSSFTLVWQLLQHVNWHISQTLITLAWAVRRDKLDRLRLDKLWSGFGEKEDFSHSSDVQSFNSVGRTACSGLFGFQSDCITVSITRSIQFWGPGVRIGDCLSGWKQFLEWWELLVERMKTVLKMMRAVA